VKRRQFVADSWPRRRILTAIAAPLVVTVPAAAQSRGSSLRTRPVATPRFRVTLPDKDWRLVPGGISTLACVVHKDDDAAIVIEHELLEIALTADDIDSHFVDLEVGGLKEGESSGSGFRGQVAQLEGRRMVVVDYQRVGAVAGEQVRIYVLVQGRHLYRMACVAPVRAFASHAPVFQLVCGSFSPTVVRV
jgi:hypothetical protein